MSDRKGENNSGINIGVGIALGIGIGTEPLVQYQETLKLEWLWALA